MDDSLKELEQLKALHLPESVSQLPLAPGWWLVLAITILSVYFLVKYIGKTVKKNAYRRAAILQLSRIFNAHQHDKDDHKLLNQVNGLLKRVAIQQYPRSHCAPMYDEQWQLFLESAVANKKRLNCDIFKYFSDVYKQQVSLEEEQRAKLLQTSREWLKKHHQLVSDNKESKGV